MTSYISALRPEAIALQQEFTAIVVLTNAIDKPSMGRLVANEVTLLTTDDESMLRAFISQMAKDVASCRDDKRATAPREQLLALLKGVRAAPPGQLAFVRKAYLARLIGWYEYYPWLAHCQIGISKDGFDPKAGLIARLAR